MIFEFLENGFQEISSSLDLSFEDDSVADEKIPFLAYLANVLKESSFFPYEPPAGSIRFRNLIAGFMKTYHHTPLTTDVRNNSSFCCCGRSASWCRFNLLIRHLLYIWNLFLELPPPLLFFFFFFCPFVWHRELGLKVQLHR